MLKNAGAEPDAETWIKRFDSHMAHESIWSYSWVDGKKQVENKVLLGVVVSGNWEKFRRFSSPASSRVPGASLKRLVVVLSGVPATEELWLWSTYLLLYSAQVEEEMNSQPWHGWGALSCFISHFLLCQEVIGYNYAKRWFWVKWILFLRCTEMLS